LRTEVIKNIEDTEHFTSKILEWAKTFDDIVFLDSNENRDLHSSFEKVLAVEAFTALKTNTGNALEQLEEYQYTTKDWIFGYLSYDLKNEIENLSSNNEDRLEFPELYFFQPKKLFFIKDDTLIFSYLRMVDDEIEDDFEAILKQEVKEDNHPQNIEIKTVLSRSKYIEKVKDILAHIHRGDIYEMNFCQEFFVENHEFNTIECFKALNRIAQAPFTCYFRHENLFAIGSSPERFLKKQGCRILSQPIKGTAKRDINPETDELLKRQLKSNPKEISENVMIVDLVRNDLSKIAKKGSVNVDELCGIYSFKQVHQMISTISAELKEDISFSDILEATFPMGSMTGAPKLSAMEIIEDLESTKRGLYSGCIGYITPEFDFDFNVVIRSILHNSKNKYTSLMVGSAITQASLPELEYEECLVKVKALVEVIKHLKA
jgi:para-aminobenzoate synthetase component 1